ncbi:hypothetical protein OAA06_00125 [bacterium]|nr:hypothetical protein [bacterium]
MANIQVLSYSSGVSCDTTGRFHNCGFGGQIPEIELTYIGKNKAIAAQEANIWCFKEYKRESK